MRLLVLGVLGLLLVAGCSTILTPNPQPVAVNSSPMGATVLVNGSPMGVTPTTINVRDPEMLGLRPDGDLEPAAAVTPPGMDVEPSWALREAIHTGAF